MFLSACLLAMLPAAGFSAQPIAVAPTTDGKFLFVALHNGVTDKNAAGFVYVWDLAKPELKAVVPGVPVNVRVIQPTADGKRFTVLCGDRWDAQRVEVYDTATKKLLHKFERTSKYGAHSVVSPDGNWVAFRAAALRNDADKAEVQVWNTETGKRVDETEKSVGKVAGTLAFTNGSKLAVASREEYVEFDPATGKKTGGWKRAEPVGREFLESGESIAVLPNGKGVVTVAPTGKRRQSYIIRVVTEKKDWFLGETWDFATAPALSPDGRLLIISAGHARDNGGTFALKLDADGAPEMVERKDNDKLPFWGARDGKVPAWREWTFGPTKNTRFGRVPVRELSGPPTYAPDGNRLFVIDSLGQINVHDTEKQALKATLFAAIATKDEVPAWHIVTAANEFVSSASEEESLAKSGKKRDAAKVKEALGAK